MNIKSTTPIKNLRGQEMKIKGPENTERPFTIGEVISSVLLNAKEGGKSKMYILAKKFIDEEDISLDEVDFALVKGAVEKSTVYGNLELGQVLIYLEDVKSEHREAKNAK